MRRMSASPPLAGVIGWPIGHSLSPRLHGHWLARYGIAGHYIPIGLAPEDFAEGVRSLPRLGFRGVNVTIPHKEAALALATEATGARARDRRRQHPDLRPRRPDPRRQHRRLRLHRQPAPGGAGLGRRGRPGAGARRRRRGSRDRVGASRRAACPRFASPTARRARAEALRDHFGPRRRGPSTGMRRCGRRRRAATVVNTTSVGMEDAEAVPLDLAAVCRGRARHRHRLRRRADPASCSPPRGAVASSPSTVSACCCIRRCPASSAGSAAGRRSTPALRAARARRMSHTASASPARSAWASRRPRRSSPRPACRSGTPTPRCTALYDRAAPARRRSPSVVPGAVVDGARRPRPAARGGRGRPGAPRPDRGARCIRSSPSDRAAFAAANAGAPLVVLDIPLLYETGAERELDGVLVVSAARSVQRERVLARPGMTPEAFDAHPRPPAAGRREAGARGLRHRHRPGPRRGARRRPIVDRADQRQGGQAHRCVRSSSTPRPPASTRRPATGSSRSARSSSSTTCRPAAPSTPTSTRSATMPEEAVGVHGLTAAFLARQAASSPRWPPAFAAFLGDGAAGDPQRRLRHQLPERRARLVRAPSIPLGARPRHPRARPAPLPGRAQQPRRAVPALRRRQLRPHQHGALLDSELLAEVYLELIGGRQPDLTLTVVATGPAATGTIWSRAPPAPAAPPDHRRRGRGARRLRRRPRRRGALAPA